MAEPIRSHAEQASVSDSITKLLEGLSMQPGLSPRMRELCQRGKSASERVATFGRSFIPDPHLCAECGRELPVTSTARRRFCSSKCRKRADRRSSGTQRGTQRDGTNPVA